MDNATPLTVEEAAKILKISKYTLYELIKRGEIPAQRIGRQLRIDPAKLFLKHDPGADKTNPTEPYTTPETQTAQLKIKSLHFAGSHDPSVNLLADFWKHSSSAYTLELSFTGSMEGLFSLYRRQAQISGIHLWDDKTQEYNTPFIQHILPGEPITLINLVQRAQGFIVQPGNPWDLKSWEDLMRKGLRFVNRQKGSGTRLRVDSYLREAQISPAAIHGYEHEEITHLGVASCIANDHADVGVGVQSEAHHLGLDFVPLFQERYDLVLLHEQISLEAQKTLMNILRASTFQNAIKRQTGYDTALTGHIIAKFN